MKCIAIRILISSPKKEHVKRRVVIRTDCLLRLERAIQTGNKTAMQGATLFLDHWVSPLLEPVVGSRIEKTKLLKQVFTTLWLSLQQKSRRRWNFISKTDGLVKYFFCTLLGRLRTYVREQQHDCNLYVQPFTYAYSMQTNKVTGHLQFRTILPQEPFSTQSVKY